MQRVPAEMGGGESNLTGTILGKFSTRGLVGATSTQADQVAIGGLVKAGQHALDVIYRREVEGQGDA